MAKLGFFGKRKLNRFRKKKGYGKYSSFGGGQKQIYSSSKRKGFTKNGNIFTRIYN